MKHLFILALLIMPVGALAVDTASRCMLSDVSSSYCGMEGVEWYSSDWYMLCTGGKQDVRVTGVGVCSSRAGADGDTAYQIGRSSTLDENKYCWCKMTSPAVSLWIFNSYPDASGTADDCALACGVECGALFQYDFSIGFSNLTM